MLCWKSPPEHGYLRPHTAYAQCHQQHRHQQAKHFLYRPSLVSAYQIKSPPGALLRRPWMTVISKALVHKAPPVPAASTLDALSPTNDSRPTSGSKSAPAHGPCFCLPAFLKSLPSLLSLSLLHPTLLRLHLTHLSTPLHLLPPAPSPALLPCLAPATIAIAAPTPCQAAAQSSCSAALQQTIVAPS